MLTGAGVTATSCPAFDQPHNRRGVVRASAAGGLAAALAAAGLGGAFAQGTPAAPHDPNIALIQRYYET